MWLVCKLVWASFVGLTLLPFIVADHFSQGKSPVVSCKTFGAVYWSSIGAELSQNKIKEKEAHALATQECKYIHTYIHRRLFAGTHIRRTALMIHFYTFGTFVWL